MGLRLLVVLVPWSLAVPVLGESPVHFLVNLTAFLAEHECHGEQRHERGCRAGAQDQGRQPMQGACRMCQGHRKCADGGHRPGRTDDDQQHASDPD